MQIIFFLPVMWFWAFTVIPVGIVTYIVKGGCLFEDFDYFEWLFDKILGIKEF